MPRLYTEHEGKVASTDSDSRFKHVMAITLDPRTNFSMGIIRCVTSRSGDLAFKGNTDRSELHKVSGTSLEHFEIGEKLNIKNEERILNNLLEKGDGFIGFEDPDIWIDKNADLMHVYFTIPIIPNDKNKKIKVHLGHAMGRDLDSLEITMPVLIGDNKFRAKELSVAPINKKGFRFNLIESKDRQNGTSYSVVQIAIVENMGESWQYGEIVFHPKEHNFSWIAGHASPGPLFSKDFIDVGEGKLLGLINGCEANQKVGDKIKYGNFSVGLFIYDYENGRIDWVSEHPFIQDSEAGKDGSRAITFASQFIETGKGKGVLYAHVDDSFVRAYTLKAELLKTILPAKFIRK